MNCEACLSEDTLCVPQRVLQQRKKKVVEAGEESRVRRGHPGLLCACFNRHNDFECPKDTNKTIHIYAPAYNKKKQSTGTACFFSVTETVAETEAVAVTVTEAVAVTVTVAVAVAVTVAVTVTEAEAGAGAVAESRAQALVRDTSVGHAQSVLCNGL